MRTVESQRRGVVIRSGSELTEISKPSSSERGWADEKDRLSKSRKT
ncbi:MAG: hypothetical protein M3Y53_01535 [Thermoproteota archaeon]|nr:hypothetical protein [Thermoproteota archaeon]MDQ6865084.1 hypothetical protein [Thermoproteota archaeon]